MWILNFAVAALGTAGFTLIVLSVFNPLAMREGQCVQAGRLGRTIVGAGLLLGFAVGSAGTILVPLGIASAIWMARLVSGPTRLAVLGAYAVLFFLAPAAAAVYMTVIVLGTAAIVGKRTAVTPAVSPEYAAAA